MAKRKDSQTQNFQWIHDPVRDILEQKLGMRCETKDCSSICFRVTYCRDVYHCGGVGCTTSVIS